MKPWRLTSERLKSVQSAFAVRAIIKILVCFDREIAGILGLLVGSSLGLLSAEVWKIRSSEKRGRSCETLGLIFFER